MLKANSIFTFCSSPLLLSGNPSQGPLGAVVCFSRMKCGRKTARGLCRRIFGRGFVLILPPQPLLSPLADASFFACVRSWAVARTALRTSLWQCARSRQATSVWHSLLQRSTCQPRLGRPRRRVCQRREARASQGWGVQDGGCVSRRGLGRYSVRGSDLPCRARLRRSCPCPATPLLTCTLPAIGR